MSWSNFSQPNTNLHFVKNVLLPEWFLCKIILIIFTSKGSEKLLTISVTIRTDQWQWHLTDTLPYDHIRYTLRAWNKLQQINSSVRWKKSTSSKCQLQTRVFFWGVEVSNFFRGSIFDSAILFFHLCINIAFWDIWDNSSWHYISSRKLGVLELEILWMLLI